MSTETSKLSESEFLKREAQRAKLDVQRSLAEAKLALAKSVDPRPIARKHPWIALASAAVAGFIAVMLAIPSKAEQELRRAERLHRAMHPDPTPPRSTNGKDQKPAEKSSFGAIIVKELIQLVRPILMAAITANIQSGATPPPGPASTDSTPPEPATSA